MKIIHIIFNIDLVQNGQNAFRFSEELPDEIAASYLEVSNEEQYETLINSLERQIFCYTWIHLSKTAALEFTTTSDLPYVRMAKKYLDEKEISYMEVTRDEEFASRNKIAYPNIMSSKINDFKSYKVSEIKNKINQTNTSESDREATKPSDRLLKTFESDINLFNNEFKNYKNFIIKAEIVNGYWWRNLFSNILDNDEQLLENIFSYRSWYFDTGVFENYLNLNTDKSVLCNSTLEVSEGIRFNLQNELWEIDFSFFNEVSTRFELNNTSDYNDDLRTAVRLFIIHETVHKYHKLDCTNVQGIGNFPRIVEYLDYQADAIAIILEVSYILSEDLQLDNKKIINSFLKVIRIAIETTFSFNAIESNEIQIRRVNRYLIWLWLYTRIEKLLIKKIDNRELIIEILKFFHKKPLIEVSGPIIFSENNRTFYNLDQIENIEEIAYVDESNILNRLGVISSIDFKSLYEGFSNSNFEILKKFIDKIQ